MKSSRKSKSLQKKEINKKIIVNNNNNNDYVSLKNNEKDNLLKKIKLKKENIYNINYLINVIKSNNLQKFEEIIKHEKSLINKLNNNGLSLLHILVIKKNIKFIEVLLKNGADVNIKSSKKKRTPLHFAYIYQNNESDEIINMLLKYGAKNNIVDKENKKPSEYKKIFDKIFDDKESKNGGENKLKKIKIKKQNKKDGYKGNVYNLKDSRDNSFVIITMDNISYLTSDENTINQLSDLSITKNNSINNSISNILNNNTLNDSLNEINTNDKNNSLYDSLEIVNDKKRNTISGERFENIYQSKYKYNINNTINKFNDINTINNSDNLDSLFTTIITNKRNYKMNSVRLIGPVKTEEKNTISSHLDYTENSTFKILNNDNTNLEKKVNKKFISQNSAMSTLSQTNKKNQNKIEREINTNYNEINKNCSFLLKWLINIGLSDYYENFLNNEIYNINKLVEQMKKPDDKLGLEDIENLLGIHTPGHIFRILIKLEIDGNIIDKKISNFILGEQNINKKLIFSSDEKYECGNCCNVNKVNINLCGIKDININLRKKNNLESFLSRYNLNHLYQNFCHNGFDQINYVLLQMYSSFPINNDILENYFHIYDEKQRKLLLESLKSEVIKINNFIESENYFNNKNKYMIKYENVDFNKNDNDDKNNNDCNIF